MKLELRAMTKSQRMRESAVMISPTMPSAKYSCSGSPAILANGNTAIDGLSGKIGGVLDGAAGFRPVSTTPIKRMSLRGMVRISRWTSPLSPTARRTALTRLVKVDSETIRPPHTAANRSSLLTTRSRFCKR